MSLGLLNLQTLLVCLSFAVGLAAPSVSRAADQTNTKKKNLGTGGASKKTTLTSSQKNTGKSSGKSAGSAAVKQASRLPASKSKNENSPVSRKEPSPFQSLPNYLQVIRVSAGPGTAKLDETVGLSVDNQFLLVPLDFVLNVWLNRSDLHFFINENQEAHLADLDLSSNLALLKTERPLQASLPRNQIRSTVPAANELLALVDGKNSMRGGPRFLATIKDEDTLRYNVLAGNDMNSGGFLFDHSARLISVVPVTSKNSSNRSGRSWVSSTQAILEFLHRQDTPRPASTSGLEDRHRQLVAWQERWTQSLLPSKQLISTQKIDCHGDLASLEDQTIASQVRQINAMSCENRTMLPLGGNYSAGFELKSGTVLLRQTGLSDQQTLLLGAAFANNYFHELDQNAKQVNLLTSQDCEESKVKNQHGQNVHVKFCTSALKTDQGLNDTVISVASVDAASHAYVVAAHLKGFDQGNTKKVMQALIENGGSLK